MEQKLLNLSEPPSSPSVFNGVRVAQILIFCVVFCRSLFAPFRLSIVSSVLLRVTASDYPFDIFKLFFVVLFLLAVVSFVLRLTASDTPWYLQTSHITMHV